tara:strand:+ start:344 stop:643 length:300 start_codon:yes stop_codon:yes gene_type:complete
MKGSKQIKEIVSGKKKTLNKYLKLTIEQVRKLTFVQKAILGRPSFQKIINGKIDLAFAVALTSLYKDDEIGLEEFEANVQRLPKFLQQSVYEEVGEDIH